MIHWDSLNESLSYKIGSATIKLSLPAKKPYCQYCQHLGCHNATEVYYCRLTDEVLLEWKRERGEFCPFIFEKEE